MREGKKNERKCRNKFSNRVYTEYIHRVRGQTNKNQLAIYLQIIELTFFYTPKMAILSFLIGGRNLHNGTNNYIMRPIMKSLII